MVYGSVAPDYVPMCRRGADYGSLPAPASRAKACVCFPCCYETRYSTPAGQGANTEICRMAWQVFDEEIHHDRCSFVIFLTVTIPAAFRGSDWNSLPGALHTHATPHEWLAPPLLCYKKKKKKEWPTFSLCSRNIWRDIYFHSNYATNGEFWKVTAQWHC